MRLVLIFTLMARVWNLSRFRRVVVYFRGLQNHTVDTKVDTKRDKFHSLLMALLGGISLESYSLLCTHSEFMLAIKRRKGKGISAVRGIYLEASYR